MLVRVLTLMYKIRFEHLNNELLLLVMCIGNFQRFVKYLKVLRTAFLLFLVYLLIHSMNLYRFLQTSIQIIQTVFIALLGKYFIIYETISKCIICLFFLLLLLWKFVNCLNFVHYLVVNVNKVLPKDKGK